MKKIMSHACIGNEKHEKVTNCKNDNEIISQLVLLTKQNQRLKEDNELLRIELGKVLNSKCKYKMMYKDVKSQLHSYHSKNRVKQNNCGSVSRENAGRIYSQPKNNVSPHAFNPSVQREKNMKVPDGNLNHKFMRNQSYGDEGNQEEFMVRISKQVMMALDALPKILTSLMTIQNYTKRHHFNLGQLQLNLDSFENQIKQRLFSNQFNLKKREKQDGSGTSAKSISQPIKEIFIANHITPPSRGNMEDNSNIERNMEEKERAEQKKYAKFVKLGMSKSLKAYKQKHLKQGSINIEQGNSSWKQLNEIGRQLKSWRVSDEDSLLLNNSHENLQEEYEINSDYQ